MHHIIQSIFSPPPSPLLYNANACAVTEAMPLNLFRLGIQQLLFLLLRAFPFSTHLPRHQLIPFSTISPIKRFIIFNYHPPLPDATFLHSRILSTTTIIIIIMVSVSFRSELLGWPYSGTNQSSFLLLLWLLQLKFPPPQENVIVIIIIKYKVRCPLSLFQCICVQSVSSPPLNCP